MKNFVLDEDGNLFCKCGEEAKIVVASQCLIQYEVENLLLRNPTIIVVSERDVRMFAQCTCGMAEHIHNEFMIKNERLEKR